MCNEYEEQWVLNDNWNNIWSVVLCLWNHIQNHRVKSLLNLWMGHSCCKNSQMCLINPLNLITQVLLPILPWCNHDLEGQTFFFYASHVAWCITTWIKGRPGTFCNVLWTSHNASHYAGMTLHLLLQDVIPDCILCCIVKSVTAVL